MSVHWNKTDAGTTKKDSVRTVRHSKAFCHCPDGMCDPSYTTPPQKELKERGNLSKRLQWFATGKPKSNYRKPGSNKK